MRNASIHRVLVVEGDTLLGVVSTTDVSDAVADHKLTVRTCVFGAPRNSTKYRGAAADRAMEGRMHDDHAKWATDVPSVEELLDVDREFRRQARSVFHTQRGVRRYAVLYSPTPLARRLGRDRDWVVIDLEEPGRDPHWTVVTERRGVLKGKRVVRSREMECFRFYQTRKRPNRAA